MLLCPRLLPLPLLAVNRATELCPGGDACYEALEFDGAADEFRPYVEATTPAAESLCAPSSWRAVRHTVRRSDGVRRAARWPDRCRVHPHRGTFHQHPARLCRTSILENNLVQTIVRRANRWRRGVIFTLPPLIFLGIPLEYSRIFLLALIGRLSGRIVYDSSAPPSSSSGNTQPALPGGHRPAPTCWWRRAGRIICRARSSGPWSGRASTLSV